MMADPLVAIGAGASTRVFWSPDSLLPRLRKPDLMGVAISPQPWARHRRQPTSLELALDEWDKANPIPVNRYGFPEWMLRMFQGDELTEET